MERFKLVSKFSPAGDQPKAIDALVRGVQNGQTRQTLLGVTGSGKTFTMANVIARLNKPTLILSPNKVLAAQLYAEFKQFFPENAAARPFDFERVLVHELLMRSLLRLSPKLLRLCLSLRLF